MMVIPVYNMIVLPDSTIYFPTDTLKKMHLGTPSVGEKVIFLIAKSANGNGTYAEDSFYPIGAAGTVENMDLNGFAMIRVNRRVNVENVFVHADGTLSVNVSARADIDDLDYQEAAEHLSAMKEAVGQYISRFQWGNMASQYMDQWTNLSEIIVPFSMWLKLSNEERYALLAEDSKAKRNSEIERILYETMEIAKVTNDAENAQKQEYQNAYREAAIKKQMELLQNELDEMHPENVSDVRKFEIKVKESGMNEEARKEADKVISRMKQEGKNSPEYGNLYDWLDFVTSLNWKPAEADQIDLKEAEQILNEDHFGLEKVKKRVIQQIAVMNLKNTQSGSILLFVGAPGTGKTSIAASIAKALHRQYVRVSLGGVRDEADIRGHRRTYIGAMPGRIMDGIAKSGVSNPVMVLDEVDKLSFSYNGDPASALLEVLDPEQNSTFTDHYMNVPYDLSNVFFICTANSLDNIPEPLLNRMEVIQFNGYTASDKFQIAKRHLLPKAMSAMGIKKENLEMEDDAIRAVIDGYTMEGGVRGLKKNLDTICRSAAVRIAEGDNAKVTVTKDNLKDFIDARPIHHEHVLDDKKAGIVTGLAWTAAGGEILFIETLASEGKGHITVTGQLGDVMKESVQIALSLVKSMYPEKEDFFETHDIHIHVPEGAVKKDGPSAGITLTTALASLVSGRPVDPHIAMTGEVSLRGNVMPIGGLPEKLMAAVRAGVTTVLIPAENVEDLKDVPEEVKEKLDIHPVTEVKEVLRFTGIMKDHMHASMPGDKQSEVLAA